MVNQFLQRARFDPPQPDIDQMAFARALIERELITPWQLFFALRRQRRWNTGLASILKTRGWATDELLTNLQSEFLGLPVVNFSKRPIDPKLRHVLPPQFCLRHCVVPWASNGDQITLAAGRPERLSTLKASLPPRLGTAEFVLAKEEDVFKAIQNSASHALADRAEGRLPPHQSCRGWTKQVRRASSLVPVFFILLLLAFSMSPAGISGMVMGWALLSLSLVTLLRLATLLSHLGAHTKVPQIPTALDRLPHISVLVPLYQETQIAHALIRRLTRLTYPRALLDIVLVLEEKDALTRETIAHTQLPQWMRVVEVPAGSGLTTKPRALNYALDFCRGEIIGIWDAEDAPARDQLEQVASHFAHADPDVACIQGVLDYYNPYTNWISRCFSIEYASWFRVILPGLIRLGFAIPLGGTTLFLRRGAIDRVRGWDAHNVTEDADLGIRLARFGYRTEMLCSVTQEEANCRALPWIRQRSRWLKGFMVTYLVHMRRPRLLWRELGPRRFFGFQLVFLTAISQFLLAPALWLLWAAAFGMPHPLENHVAAATVTWLAVGTALAACLNGAIALLAVARMNRPRLYPFILTMGAYFPMATLAAYKGLYELLTAPYYWDKTEHGKTKEAHQVDFDPTATG